MATKHILIVEDERPLAHALELKLQHEGMETTIAENGETALKMLADKPVDVMLLDLMMPVMDGFEVLERINALPKKPIVFVLTNLSVPDDKEKVKSLGATKYFVKADTPLTTIVEEIKKA